MKDGVCHKCSATTIMPNVSVLDHGHYNAEQDLMIAFHENPKGIFFRGTHKSRLRAWICGTCGYTELYVAAPRALYAAYLEAQRRQ